MSCICDWCGREFTVKDVNGYSLDCAGKSLCLDCADTWEVELVRMHCDKIRARFDILRGRVNTENGYNLPVLIYDFHGPRWPWEIGYQGEAVDSFGRHWHANLAKDNFITLKPVRK